MLGAVQDPIGEVAIKGGPGWRPRQDERWAPGVSLAVLAHLGLVLALALAMNWKVKTEVAVEAEVWSEIPRAAGPAMAPPPEPKPEPVPPKAEPAVAPEPKPEPRPEPKVEAKPDIVAERTPKKEPKEKKRKEPKETFDTTPPKPSRKPDPKPEPKPEVKPKAEAKPAPKQDAKPDPKTDAKADKQSAAEREALRQAHLARMMSDLGGGPGGSGRAGVAAGPSKSYIGRLIARIKPNVVFTDAISGNPLAQVEVRCAPDGRIVSTKLIASSGVPAWDVAVLRALERTEVLPLNEQGRIEPVMQLDFRPKDF